MSRRTLCRLGFAVVALGATLLVSPAPGHASGGGGGGGVDTVKINKCEYAVTGGCVELLISGSSSNSNAVLVAYLPDGEPLGFVQNGGGGRYGGTVFLSMYVPTTITLVSSYGGFATAECVPYQP